MTRTLAALSFAAATLFAANAQAQYYDGTYGETFDVDMALGEGDYDNNLAGAAAADGIAPGHIGLLYYKDAAGNPFARACYPNGAGQLISVSGGSLTAFIAGVAAAQGAAINILNGSGMARIGRGVPGLPC